MVYSSRYYGGPLALLLLPSNTLYGALTNQLVPYPRPNHSELGDEMGVRRSANQPHSISSLHTLHYRAFFSLTRLPTPSSLDEGLDGLVQVPSSIIACPAVTLYVWRLRNFQVDYGVGLVGGYY